MASVELILAHLVSGSLAGGSLQVLLLCGLLNLARRRIFLAIFVFVYLNVTLWVNLTDFLFSGLIMDYYHDEFFLSSFSYKIHHLALCAIVAFIGSEFMSPSSISQNKPKVLTHL